MITIQMIDLDPILDKNRVSCGETQSGSITPARTATTTASILVRTRSFEQTFSKYGFQARELRA